MNQSLFAILYRVQCNIHFPSEKCSARRKQKNGRDGYIIGNGENSVLQGRADEIRSSFPKLLKDMLQLSGGVNYFLLRYD